MKTGSNINTLEYTAGIKEQFSELIFHLRNHVSKVEDPKGKNLFKISARIITRLQKALMKYEEKLR